MINPIFLGVNIDHIATLRQARGTRYPDVVFAAFLAEQAGADGITVHLREDRRHIQERDLFLLTETIETRLNLELAITPDILTIAEKIRPAHVCFVPERREEITTEGGLEVVAHSSLVREAVLRMQAIGAEVSLFIDPDLKQIEASKACGASTVELHTGQYAESMSDKEQAKQLHRIEKAAEVAHHLGLIVNAGHGLHYHNTAAIARIAVLHELNIGHAIVARALFVGLERAVSEMKALMQQARGYL